MLVDEIIISWETRLARIDRRGEANYQPTGSTHDIHCTIPDTRQEPMHTSTPDYLQHPGSNTLVHHCRHENLQSILSGKPMDAMHVSQLKNKKKQVKALAYRKEYV